MSVLSELSVFLWVLQFPGAGTSPHHVGIVGIVGFPKVFFCMALPTNGGIVGIVSFL